MAVDTLSGLVILSRNVVGWGYTSRKTLLLAAVVAATGVVSVRRSLRIRHPILQLRIFANRTFAVAMVLVAMVTGAQFAKLNFLPVELQVVRGMSAVGVGLLLAPSGLAISLLMPLGGHLADRLGARIPVIAGLMITMASTAMLANLRPTTSIVMLRGVATAQGFGGGLMYSPLQVTAMGAVRSSMVAHASALTQLNRQVSAAVGTAVMAGLLMAQLGSMTPPVSTPAEIASAQAGYNSLFALAAWMLVAGLLPALALPGRRSIQQGEPRRVS